jgi:hypothetical protein
VLALGLVGCQPTAPHPTLVPTTAPAVGTSRIDLLNAADTAFTRGDLTTASGLYERVVNTPPSAEDAATSAAIDGFAHLRDMVTLLADGRESDAHAQLTELQQADANGAFTRLGTQLWDQYGMVGELGGACAQLQPQIVSEAGQRLALLQGVGVNVDAQTVCSVPPESGG